MSYYSQKSDRLGKYWLIGFSVFALLFTSFAINILTFDNFVVSVFCIAGEFTALAFMLIVNILRLDVLHKWGNQVKKDFERLDKEADKLINEIKHSKK